MNFYEYAINHSICPFNNKKIEEYSLIKSEQHQATTSNNNCGFSSSGDRVTRILLCALILCLAAYTVPHSLQGESCQERYQYLLLQQSYQISCYSFSSSDCCGEELTYPYPYPSSVKSRTFENNISIRRLSIEAVQIPYCRKTLIKVKPIHCKY